MRNILILSIWIAGFVVMPAVVTAQTDEETRINALIAQLGANNMEERNEAFEILKALGSDARPYLKEALDSEDPEISWRASKLLTEMEGKKIIHLGRPDEEKKENELSLLRDRMKTFKKLPGFRMGPLPNDFFKDHRDFFQGPFGDLFKDFLAGVPFGDIDEGMPGVGFRFFDGSDFFELDNLMESLKRDQGGFKLEIDGEQANCHMRMESATEEGTEVYTLDIAEDGSVKAKVKKIDGASGSEEENIYEAENLDAFKKAYPEIAERFHFDRVRIGMSAPGFSPNIRGFRKPGTRDQQSWFPNLHRQGKRKTLGVYINPDGPDKVLRAQMNLKEGEGVIIEEVLAGSFADTIGVEPYDVIVKINEESVGSAEDVGRILAGVEEGDEVKVSLIRSGAQIDLAGRYPASNRKRL